MQPKYITRLGAVALLIAWSFDQLFWQKPAGISFFIFVALCLGGGFYFTWVEKQKAPTASLWLVIVVLELAALTFIRQEPVTLVLDYWLTLACMFVLAFTWLGGRWWQYGAREYAYNGLGLLGGLFSLPAQAYMKIFNPGLQPEIPGEQTAASALALRFHLKSLFAVFIGLLLALPLLAILAALLSQADPVFLAIVRDLLQLIRLERLFEYSFRLIYVVVGAYLLSGAYLYAVLSSRQETLPRDQEGSQFYLLGWLEASTVLVCINLLFAFFVAVQFQYFFGGQGNIHLQGYTYSEYARRGFGELVIVALISLLIYLGLSGVTRRTQPKMRRLFSGLGTALFGLVAVILVSAFQRLLLYEAAYGFSRQRTYTHVFMLWLGVFLGVVVILEAIRRLRYFYLAAFITCLGFALTLNLLNVDAFIARQNIARTVSGADLDSNYLMSLSDDALPVLFERYLSAELPSGIEDQVGVILACRIGLAAGQAPLSWPSRHWSTVRASRLYQSHPEVLDRYSLGMLERRLHVQVRGVWQKCPLAVGEF